MRNFIFIFFFSILMIIHLCSSQNLINSACKSFAGNNPNIDYDFCRTSLQAAPASQCAALQGLGMISIRLVRYNVTDTRCAIKQLLKKKKKWDPYTKQCLEDCLDLFSDAIPAVKEAMKSFNAKRFDDANVKITSIMDAATTCQDGFMEKTGVVSPLTTQNDHAFRLSAITLSFMRTIQARSA